ncbi:dihydrolipoamide acetyltransferase family protein [Cryptosporangium aurantiacum]|uniref:Dihydrolipoamide acetyltransferase component of pyruvate dehydrogenase complex n=1 Tax=Cryptosporangium aurantiacum TaxID=134849 RepID=A0A1M7RMJ2_9ACTN|nr:dihydrolipoamide acetyltransferase family protein [Cryptosporangium aurantiacum]SHN47322.1 pyruvate dehydrogenase E2 component (dihydrolipoamide acetyltransferase) [Cryptosporangium aurantiacum]
MARLLRMPEVAANVTEAVLAEWALGVGSSFAAAEMLATVETDKAVVDVPADAGGVLLKTLVAAGETVPVGSPIAVLGDPGEAPADLDAVLAALGVGGRRVFASPLVRRLAAEAGMAVEDLVGTGPGGRVVKRDFERALQARQPAAGPAPPAPAPVPPPGPAPGPRPGPHPPPAPVQLPRPAPASALPPGPARASTPEPDVEREVDVEAAFAAGSLPGSDAERGAGSARHAAAGYREIPHTRMRRAIAARLTASATEAPHFTVRGTARVDDLLELRARLNAVSPAKISITDLVVAAAARAHVDVPELNVVWTPDAVRAYDTVDVAIAVATDDGLVTPVLRGVDRAPISAIATASADLVARARAGRIRPDELVGGTLTVTSLGGYDVEEFAAVLNPPHAAILAVGAAREEPVARDGALTVATVLRVTLTVDHRPVDGVVAARWMAAFLDIVHDPLRILL